MEGSTVILVLTELSSYIPSLNESLPTSTIHMHYFLP